MRHALTLFALLSIASLAHAATRNNDDSCDIAVMPAATLLLPYFEVDLNHYGTGPTTRFTVTNVTAEEQIAHVTLWTDWSYPVASFNIYLTGYDQQLIDLADILVSGWFVPFLGTGVDVSERGNFSIHNQRLDLTDCREIPPAISADVFHRMQLAFTTGRVQTPDGCMQPHGEPHKNAIGYATIDVVRSCTTGNPTTPGYLTNDILWDNVLTGDYDQFDDAGNRFEGGPMVHIRAIPEGGTAAEHRNMPESYQISSHRTFYSRFLPANMHTFDGRQPLPSVFAARWEQDRSWFTTSFKIWREGVTGANARCGDYAHNYAEIADVVIFDEEENPEGIPPSFWWEVVYELPSTLRISINDTTVFPQATAGAVRGWVYLNLDSQSDDTFAMQGWVISSIAAGNRFSLDSQATALGNGCTPPVAESEVSKVHGAVIGPAPNVNP